MIYLDNNATTRPDKDAMEFALSKTYNCFGNPSSLHTEGILAAEALYKAREQVASAMGCATYEVFFTSGGTEANNLALAQTPFRKFVGRTEHSSIYNNNNVTYINVNNDGTTDLNHLESLLSEHNNLSTLKSMTSIMLANNETGVISDPKFQIPSLCKKYNSIYHVDSSQGFGKHGVPWKVTDLMADIMTVSAHKINGPKGIGALYLKEGIKDRKNSLGLLSPIFSGGPHERGLRPGTENIFGAVALGHICDNHFKLNIKNYHDKLSQTSRLRDRLENALIDISSINGNINRIGNTVNLYFHEIEDVELLTDMLSERGLVVSGKSACSSGLPEPSRVLAAMYGADNERLRGSIRLSLSNDTTEKEIDGAVDIIKATVHDITILMKDIL